MSLFTIADLHLSLGCEKPMDIFEGWQDYVPRLEANWRRLVKPEDTVVIGGDISWAMKLEETLADFTFIHSLPGTKILLKGNHDYWWCTMAKMQEFLIEHALNSLHFLFNNSYEVEGISVCGTRSWMHEPGQPHDEKVLQREVGRLRMSLQAATCPEKLVFLHYPPVYGNARTPEIVELLEEFAVKRCFYGHLHGGSIRWAVQGDVEGVFYKLVSADSVEFVPQRIQ